MRTLVVVENLSLDGVMQAPGRPDWAPGAARKDERGGFPYGGWASEMLSDDPEVVQASMGDTGSGAQMLFGRRTYLDLPGCARGPVGHWLSTPDPNPFTEILRTTPKHVASNRSGPRPSPAARSSLATGWSEPPTEGR
jgi:hypothetical protein